MLGGFIWDWVDQGIALNEKLEMGNEKWAGIPKGAILYGGVPYKAKKSKKKPLPASLIPLVSTIKPQVYRAPTDNDKSFGNWLAKDWKRCGLDTLTIPMTTEQDGNEFTFTFEIPDSLPEIPRLGILIELPRDYEQLSWYGRGPWDNYPDRQQSCPIGLWKSTVSQQYVHYPRPQDSGNHEDCTMVELKTKKGKTLRIEAVDKAFSFSALPYSAQYLASKSHDYELQDQGKTYLSIDCAVMGLGNSSCGPGVLKKYTIDKTRPRSISFAFASFSSALEYGPNYEPSVKEDGLNVAIVFSHHVESFHQRVTMMLCRVATLLKVGHYHVRIHQSQSSALCFLHDTDAPVHIRRVSVLQVIGKLTGYIQTHIESLMTHQHTLLKRAPRQRLWRPVSAQSEEVALSIRRRSVAIDDCRSAFRLFSYRLYGVLRIQRIARIQEHYIVARSLLQSLVHGVIQSLVCFRLYPHLVRTRLFVFFRYFYGIILRSTVNNQVFYMRILLTAHTVQCPLQATCCVIGNGNYRYPYHLFNCLGCMAAS